MTTKTIGLKLSTLKISQVLNGEADDKMFYKVSGETAEGRSLKRVKLPVTICAVNTRQRYQLTVVILSIIH